MELQLPSAFKDQLKLWRGQKIVSMTRLLNDDPESIPSLYDIPEEKIFSYFPAPLILELSNREKFGIQVNSAQASVMICETDGMFDETDSIPVKFSDAKYAQEKYAHIDESPIENVSIFIRHPQNQKLASRAREAGIGITFMNGKKLVLSCGLHDGSDTFSIIYAEEIPDRLKQELNETSIFNG